MKHSRLHVVALGSAIVLASSATAQTNVSFSHKVSWSENCGWMNWRDAGAPPGSSGAHFHDTFVSGLVWCENIGWINLGDGTPGAAGGTLYANTTGADFGVNISGAGYLFGLAWSENAGWINFTLPSLPVPEQPRLDSAADRLRGYAWGENVGWINLDDATSFVGIFDCGCDFNHDGVLNSQDFFDFIAAFFNEIPPADFNNDSIINSQDFFDFVSCFFADCP